MLLKSITLENFAAYRHKNTIDFSVKGSRENVILIGGENGAGKTTLLNAIKIALFGPYAYGLKTESAKYTKTIYNYLNTKAIKNEDSNFQLTLSFNETEDFEKTEYEFVRSWEIKNNKLKENLGILKNGRLLSDSEAEIYQTKLRENMPPELFDLCLFDGEEISRIIGDNLLSTYLQRLSKVVFNLKLFENLETDLNTYSDKKTKDHSNDKLNQEIDGLEKELKEKEYSKYQLEDLINNKRDAVDNMKNELSTLKKDFETHGGLYKEQRDVLVAELNEIENTRKELNNEVKNYIGVLLPFNLNKDLLDATVKQLDSENTQQVFNQLSNKLTNQHLSSILDDLGFSPNESKREALKKSLIKNMQPDHDLILHHASNDQRNKVAQVNDLVNSKSSDHYDELLTKNQDLLKEAQSLRSKVNIHDETNEFTHMIQKMEQLKVKIESEEQNQQSMEQQLQHTNDEIVATKNLIEEKQKEIFKNHKQKNALNLLNDLINTSKEFRSRQLQRKLQEVEAQAMKMLKKLMRKQKYIESISIVPETFEIQLFDKNHNELFMDKLSAGEKEILLLSLIWAMFEVSGRRVPFIFDTLLGRLDKTHKSTVLSELIPLSGEQTLVLSTDTEIDEYHYQIIKPYLSHVYTLEFDNETHGVDIKSNYFFVKDNEVV
ncbi:DNA sulfur modification protein DndD [Halobacillus faecis]